MANIYTEFPKPIGESNLAKCLSSIEDDKLHLWFGLNFIPGVRDIDILLYHENAGFFVIEVKAVSLDSIEEFGWQSCKIKGRSRNESPHIQTDEALYSFINFLRPQVLDRSKKVPYFRSTACFPLIKREEWNQSWDDLRVMGEFAESFIFQEDFEKHDKLISRLQHIWWHPPAKTGAKFKHIHRGDILEIIKDCLYVNAKKKPALSDLEKLKILEEEIKSKTKKQAKELLKNSQKIWFSGYPGTGKTFRLLQIGLYHVFSGRDVLYVCFNKVLASDLRRLFSYSSKIPASQGSLKVYDIFDIARKYKIGQYADDYDQWGIKILSYMKTFSNDLPKYDMILVDEAQDMKDWQLEMIDLFRKPNTTILVAAGSGQELYGEKSNWLTQFQTTARKQSLRRNFRNSGLIGKLSHIFYEIALDISKIDKVTKGLLNPKVPQTIVFDRLLGEYPKLVTVEKPKENIDDLPFDLYKDLVAEEYKKVIKFQLEQLTEEDNLLDILILVPIPNSSEKEFVSRALELLQVSFIDYTNEKNRRDIAQPEMIRLCTFHSSHGIEGKRVIIFGCEDIVKLSEAIKINFRNLGYIIFSRSIIDCVIGVKPVYNPSLKSPVITFIEDVLNILTANNESDR